MAVDRGDVRVTSFGGCNEGGGDQGDRNIYLQAAEHGEALHSYLPLSGPMLVYREEAGITDNRKVVGKIVSDIPK